jgi:hypothetical protein
MAQPTCVEMHCVTRMAASGHVRVLFVVDRLLASGARPGGARDQHRLDGSAVMQPHHCFASVVGRTMHLLDGADAGRALEQALAQRLRQAHHAAGVELAAPMDPAEDFQCAKRPLAPSAEIGAPFRNEARDWMHAAG